MRQPTKRRIPRFLVWLTLFCMILTLVSCNNRPETVSGGGDLTSLATGLTTTTAAGETPSDNPDVTHDNTTVTDPSATGVSSADSSDANTSVPTGGNQTKQTASTTVYTPPYSDVSQEEIIIPGHKHAFEKVWSADEYTHFRRATCGHNVVTNRGAHAYNENGTCTICGYTHRTHLKGTLVSLCLKNQLGYSQCGVFKCGICGCEFYAPVTHEDLGLPVINLTGSLSGISKTKKVTVGFTYNDGKKSVDCACTLKVQGNTAATFEKKNYSMQLFTDSTLEKKNKVEFKSGWGKQSKFCLKANYVDYSQARNVVSGQLFNQIVKTRKQADEVTALANGGVVDGFPCVIYLNGEFLGLYTFNIPKDKWMFGMEETGKQAILMADDWSKSMYLNEPMPADFSGGWDLEFCSTEDTSWVVTSFNKMSAFVRNNSGAAFKNGLSAYVDVDNTIDAMLYTEAICGWDNVCKNVLWVTYDGTHWFTSVYDMDASWGMVWDGKSFYEPETGVSSGFHQLWKKMGTEMRPEIRARWAEIRQKVLNMNNIRATFGAFLRQIPAVVRNAERQKWPAVPSQNTNNDTQIFEFARRHLAYLDKQYGYSGTL